MLAGDVLFKDGGQGQDDGGLLMGSFVRKSKATK